MSSAHLALTGTTQLPPSPARDLAWLLFSPDVLADAAVQWPTGALDGLAQWLQQAETPAELVTCPARFPGRLGRYAETLLETAIRQVPEMMLLAANLPLRRTNFLGNGQAAGIKTLGELDLVWRDLTRNRVVHWELATKFYLCAEEALPAGDLNPLRRFVGPNLADRLSDKLRHLSTCQLALSRLPEARAALGCHVDIAEPYLKGWLFYPLGHAVPCLLGLAPDHLRGWWASWPRWRQQIAGEAERWCILPRMQWLSSAWLPEAYAWTTETLLTWLEQVFLQPGQGPIMVCCLQAGGEAGMWEECSRGFVVPEAWPEQAQRYALAG